MGLIGLPLEEGKTLRDEIIPAAKRAASLVPISSKEAEPFLQFYILKTLTDITRLCQLILYIAAQNADIRERGWPGKEGRRPDGPRDFGPVEIKDTYREIRGWDVGYQIVDKMAAMKREQTVTRKKYESEKQSAPMAEAGLKYIRMLPVPICAAKRRLPYDYEIL